MSQSDTSSCGSDQIKLTYNTDGSLASRTDQRGTVLDYTYTSRRQLEMDQVTTLGVDGSQASRTDQIRSQQELDTPVRQCLHRQQRADRLLD